MQGLVKKIVLVVFVGVFALGLASCKSPAKQTSGEDISNGAYPISVKDDTGQKVVIKKEVMKIVSLSPSNTEILFALGLDDKIVGVDDFSDYPKEALDKEKVGGFSKPNIEKIVALDPDLVLSVASMQADAVTELKRLKINVFALESQNIADIVSAIEKVGKITGSDSEAKRVADKITAKIEEVQSRTKDIKKSERPKVFFELYNDPLMSAGSATFIGDMISIAGGRNIAAPSKEAYPQFSLETLVNEDPQVYLAASGSMTDPGDLINRPGWESLTAVKDGKVFVLDENLINRPGPRVVEGLEQVAKSIHPEIFKD